jgi:hypothetical protein
LQKEFQASIYRFTAAINLMPGEIIFYELSFLAFPYTAAQQEEILRSEAVLLINNNFTPEKRPV